MSLRSGPERSRRRKFPERRRRRRPVKSQRRRPVKSQRRPPEILRRRRLPAKGLRSRLPGGPQRGRRAGAAGRAGFSDEPFVAYTKPHKKASFSPVCRRRRGGRKQRRSGSPDAQHLGDERCFVGDRQRQQPGAPAQQRIRREFVPPPPAVGASASPCARSSPTDCRWKAA